MSTPAQIKANIKYNKTRDCITLRPTKEFGAAIRAAAVAAGMSTQAYLFDAAREKMKRDAAASKQAFEEKPE